MNFKVTAQAGIISLEEHLYNVNAGCHPPEGRWDGVNVVILTPALRSGASVGCKRSSHQSDMPEQLHSGIEIIKVPLDRIVSVDEEGE